MRFLLSAITLLLLISCKKKYLPRNIKSIVIKEFPITEKSSIRAIIAIDENTFYFAGSNGKFGYSLDGGKTIPIKTVRYQDSIFPNFRSIAFNGKDVFMFSIGNPALLYKYSEKQFELAYKEVHEKVFYDAITFLKDKKHGIAVGDPIDKCASIVLTDDGGNTWKKLSCKEAPKFENGEAFFAASNTNIATIKNTIWIASGGKKANVYKSLDYGKTWNNYSTPIVQGLQSQGIYSIDFTNTNNGIVIGGDYTKPNDNYANKAITLDGGKTWQLVSKKAEPNYKSCIQYVPNTNGQEIFAVGKTGVSFSNDGGKSFQKVSDEAYYTIQFVNKNIAWLSGNNKIGKLILED